MDLLLGSLVLLVLYIFEPGNEEINAYCTASLAGETSEEFSSRKECWDAYHEYRDEIPTL